ncbi:galactose mutarotase-like domain-containing protein [Coniella lustricola]|uniref:Galactose mutarotase-like domain-containing protein n=1 Tax=Coniella lustricola TaxID=2025994 RepID=A0A2T3AAJ4_9PEZI|nr:galactose mutarotase-like domain-containing protein [Coniella lustricola]
MFELEGRHSASHFSDDLPFAVGVYIERNMEGFKLPVRSHAVAWPWNPPRPVSPEQEADLYDESPADSTSILQSPFTMASSDEISFLPIGAVLQSFSVAGVNLVQGFTSQDDYEAHNTAHFGATIGRVANRIANATIRDLNGKSYSLAANNGPNSLHGGPKGWGKRIWQGPQPLGVKKEVGSDIVLSEGGESVKFTLRSDDGDEGFPGTVDVSVVYTAGKTHEDGKEVTVLGIEYEAKLVGGSEETAINMTNHSYFNLTGGPSIEGTEIRILTNSHLPVDSNGIPTSGPAPYSKFSGGHDKPFTLGATEPDVDDCFVANPDPKSVPIDTRSEPLAKLVAAYHPESKIHLEVLSTEPAFQFYTGKYIDIPAVGGLPARGARAGFCVEPSRWVNAVNEPEWKSQVLLKKGETYGARIVYKAWKD